MLKRIFDKDRFISALKFPASGGQKAIKETHDNYIYEKFLEMIKYSPKYSVIQQCKDKDVRQQLMNEFFHGKLEKIRAILENRQPEFKSKFKSAIQDYLKSVTKVRTTKQNDLSQRLSKLNRVTTSLKFYTNCLLKGTMEGKQTPSWFNCL